MSASGAGNSSASGATPIVIIGTGFSGLGLAIRLRLQGREDFVVLERASEVGGSWRDNTYPGCACDVQSHLYSFSFAPNPDWSRAYSPQPEILRYLKSCADRFDVRRFVRFGCAVRSMKWVLNEKGVGRWFIETSDGEWTAQTVVLATGPLSEPFIPVLDGLSSFRGEAFHSSQWPSTFDPRGKQVAVIGTGASAVQFIPILQKQVAKLFLFQRTAAWVVPRPNKVFRPLEKWIFKNVPIAQRRLRANLFWLREALGVTFRHPRLLRLLEWASLRTLKRVVRDPILRAKLTPHFTIGCKRILLSDEYWPALAKPNVEVITNAITHVTESGLHTETSPESSPGSAPPFQVDAIIFATGFRVTDAPIYNSVVGRMGLSLAQAWAGSPRAYLGTMVHGFPNLFLLLGPNTGLGHSSVVLMVEAQIAHVLKLLERLKQVNAIEPRLPAQDAYVREVDAAMTATVWSKGGCQSWYLDRTGRNSTIWPKSVVSFQKLIHASSLDDYQET